MKITVIEKDSPAFKQLAEAFANPDTYKVSVHMEPGHGLQVKRNEGTWTTPLSVDRPKPVGLTIVIGQRCWGSGRTLQEAKAAFRDHGGRLSLGYSVVAFDSETEFKGVDGMGSVHYDGNEPTITERPPRKTG